jgi:glutamate 5-kinase
MGRLGIHNRPKSIPQLQALASVGQNLLMNAYEKAFGMFEIPVGQVLLTVDDIHDRKRYVNVNNTLEALIKFGAVPIVNENDTVCVDEVKVGDNDNLSSYVSSIAGADLLVLFTDVDGLYNCNPKNGGGSVIPLVTDITSEIEGMCGGAGDKASVGGMVTKIQAARRILSAGGMMVIAHGRKVRLTDILGGKEVGTLFYSGKPGLAARRHWIAMTARVRGHISVDKGAELAIARRNASLLPRGIIGVDGVFDIGDVVSVTGETGEEIARGVAVYNHKDVRTIMGRHSDEIDAVLGYSNGDTIIHRDDLVRVREFKQTEEAL